MRSLFAPALLLAAFVFPCLAFAQTPKPWNQNDLDWAGPTTCSDGSALTNCQISQWRIERANSPTATTWTAIATIPASAGRKYSDTSAAAGLNCYRVKAIMGPPPPELIFSVPSDVLQGPAINSCVTNTQPAPGKPGPVMVASLTAYELRQDESGVMQPVRVAGIPANSMCVLDVVSWPVEPTDAIELHARCSAS